MFVLGVAKILKLDMEKVEQTIENFNPLEHRLENAGTYNNITYYNDSISTLFKQFRHRAYNMHAKHRAHHSKRVNKQ